MTVQAVVLLCVAASARLGGSSVLQGVRLHTLVSWLCQAKSGKGLLMAWRRITVHLWLWSDATGALAAHF